MKSFSLQFLLLFFSLTLSSCYKTLTIDNFNKNEWTSFEKTCSRYRLNAAELLLQSSEIIIESTQNEIESLLGAPDEHELYSRNQKFFHYRLSPPDTCESGNETTKFLSIRFNAIGMATDIQVVVRE